MDDARSSGCGDVDGVKAGRTRARGRGRPAQRTGESARGRPAPQAVAERRATPCAAAPSLLRAIIDDDKVLNASVAEAGAERARRRALGRARCCAAWRRGRSRGAGDGAGTGARRALYGQRTSTPGTAERRTGVRARPRPSSFGARPQCQRAQEERARKSRATGTGRSGLRVSLEEGVGLQRVCKALLDVPSSRPRACARAPNGHVLASL